MCENSVTKGNVLNFILILILHKKHDNNPFLDNSSLLEGEIQHLYLKPS